MNVRFQKTARGEVAILPRKEYEALVAKAAEADEDRRHRALGGARATRGCGWCSVVAEECGRSAWPMVRIRVRVLREWRDMHAAVSVLQDRSQPRLHLGC